MVREKLIAARFREVVWLVPVVFLLHEMEEWYIMDWFARFFVETPASDLSVRLWLVGVTADIAFLTWLSTRFANEKVTAYVMVGVVGLLFANGLQHLFWVLHFGAYAPGVFFGAVAGIPVYVYVAYRALSARLVPRWYVVSLAFYAAIVLGFTISAGNRLPPDIRLIHAFSDWVASLLA